ncbi:MAG: hypothetical protein H6Q72_1972 [Firmicutes bacterium]|nr:hypothetical protein [Bacillota bacterium]
MVAEEFQIVPVDSINVRHVSTVFQSVYGNDFPVKDVYDPDILWQEISAGRVNAALAFDWQGQPAGYVSMFKNAPNPRLWEAGNMVIHPAFKYSNLSSLLTKIYFEPAVIGLTDYNGIFCEAVCHHYVTQIGAAKSGLHDCAIELLQLSAESFKDHRAVSSQRISCVMSFQEKSEPITPVYVPPEYVGIVGSLVQSLKPRAILPADGPLPMTGLTVREENYYAAAQTWKISVREIGADWLACLDELLHEAASRKVISLQIAVNTAYPALGAAVKAMRDRGFFLGGLLPQWFGSDGLLLQKLLETEPDYEQIKLYSKTAKDLLAFIRADREAVNR